ncbi:MAG: hypothetical protein AABY32_06700 [Nanoarchaeota archaeon]
MGLENSVGGFNSFKKFTKKMRSYSLVAGLGLATYASFSCEELGCDGMGTLSLENASHNTVQRIMINGVNYGTIDDGETKKIKLTPGTYAWQLVGISGGTGCSAAVVTIVECKTSSFKCDE